MFLFTTPTGAPSSPPPAAPSNAAAPAGPVTDAIRRGAERTGTSFDYLVATAKRESALDPTAKASTSSAAGLFQFIEQTWLGVVKSDGDKAGIGSYAEAITARPDGTLGVGDAATRQAILKLREDPAVASVMAGALTRQNRDALASATGREPTSGELYAAHVLGARGAADLIRTARQSPGRTAALDFPDAAAANRGIFYDRGGRPRGAAEVYATLAAGTPGPTGTGSIPAVTAAAPITPPDAADLPIESYGSGGTSLFQTGRRAGPISDAVAKIWRANQGSARVSSSAPSFFPRGDAAAAAAGAGSATGPADMVVAKAQTVTPDRAPSPAPVAPIVDTAIFDASVPWPPARPPSGARRTAP